MEKTFIRSTNFEFIFVVAVVVVVVSSLLRPKINCPYVFDSVGCIAMMIMLMIFLAVYTPYRIPASTRL